MLKFMVENKKLLKLHEQKFAEFEAYQADMSAFQANTNDSLKNLEAQVGQLAQILQNQSRDYFHSNNKKNSEDCMTIH